MAFPVMKITAPAYHANGTDATFIYDTGAATCMTGSTCILHSLITGSSSVTIKLISGNFDTKLLIETLLLARFFQFRLKKRVMNEELHSVSAFSYL